jgi:serine/threonine protein kinase, bacterial
MTYCVNPDCPVPENLDSAEACASCGSSLLLNQRYQPIRVLGQGGFGATFIARNMSLPGTPVCAVKQLRIASVNPQAIDRARQLFEREATTLGKIGNHPQVPSLLDYFEDDCQFYLVQEYVKGWTLKQEVKRSGPFDEAKIRAFLLETLTLLKYFQHQEVIHRDIKPANIIRRSIDGHLVFIDFGAVKDEVSQTMLLSDENNPNTAFAIGTPGFAPPEQLGMHPTYASDIYALGATCLYLMTGQSPKRFGRDPRTGAINWHGQIPLSAGLTAILDKMLQPQTASRYAAAALVINDLQRLNAQVNAPVIAPPPSPPLESVPTPDLIVPSRPPQASITEPPPTSFAEQPPVRPSSANPAPTPSSSSQRSTHPDRSASKWKPLEQLHAEQNSDASADDSDEMPPLNTSNLAAARFHVPSSGSRTSFVKTYDEERVTVRSLCRAYSQGHRDFASCNLSGADLHGIDLSEINFNESKLIRTNLSSTNLYRADLSQAGLSQANFRDANLTGAFLSYANLAGADLRGANLSSAHLSYANLNGANLSGANLTGARVTPEQLSQAKTNWRTIMPNGKRGLFS